MKTLLLTFTLIGLSFWLSANDTLKTKQANQWLQNTPLQFTENKGQITENGKPRTDILYAVKGKGVNLHLTKNSIRYTWSKVEYKKQAKKDKPFDKEIPEIDKITSHTVAMNLLNTNPHVQVIAQDQALEIQNYYNVPSTPEGITNVKSYTKIIYKEIYPKIDLIIYTKSPLTPKGGTKDISPTGSEGVLAPPSGAGGALKYDFIIHPDGNPKNIQIQYTGQESINLNPDGSLTLKHALGELTEAAPYTYQGSTPIPCQYQLNTTPPPGAGGLEGHSSPSGGGGGFISFALGTYNTSLPLTIDPDLIWATYYGGSGGEIMYSIMEDNQKNIYVVGETNSTNNISAGGFQNLIGGGVLDGFLVKFNSSGQRIWATYYGGANEDRLFYGVINSNFDIYVVGFTLSPNLAFGTVHQSTSNGNYEVILIKFNKDGQRIWATYYGGEVDDYSGQLALDIYDNLYMSGLTQSSTNIAFNGHQNVKGGGYDSFVAKINPSGQRIWATYYGGDSYDAGGGLVVDIQNNVYFTGNTFSSNNISTGVHQNIIGGSRDGFLVKLDSVGNLVWGTYYGGSGVDYGYFLEKDDLNNIYLSGITTSSNNISFNGHQNLNGGGNDVFLAKFDNLGNRIWATYYGGSGSENYCRHYVFNNKIFLAGNTTSSNNIAFNGFQNEINGGVDIFIAVFDNLGGRIWSSYFGGEGNEGIAGIYINQEEKIYISGATLSINDIAFNGHQNTIGGGQDAFLAKFCGSFTSNNPSLTIQTTNASGSIFCDYPQSFSFNANVVDMGTNPTVEWYVNGGLAGTGVNFTSGVLGAGDRINAKVLANREDCLMKKDTVSLPIFIEQINPTLSIQASESIICPNTYMTFTAEASGLAGFTPSYIWRKKANPNNPLEDVFQYGTNSNTLSNGDTLEVEMKLPALSPNCRFVAEYPITISSQIPHQVALSSNTGDVTACFGDTIVMRASSNAEGSNATYKWTITNLSNNTKTEVTNSDSTYILRNIQANTRVEVLVRSSLSCAFPKDKDASFTINAVSVQPTSVSITTANTTVCQGTSVSFRATPSGGGVEPDYQWFVNGTPRGDNENEFDVSNLDNGSQVSVRMRSKSRCAEPDTAFSAPITMTVIQTPRVTLSSSLGNLVCSNAALTFKAKPEGAISNVQYRWLRNDVPHPDPTNVENWTSDSTLSFPPDFFTPGSSTTIKVIMRGSSIGNCFQEGITFQSTYSFTSQPSIAPQITISSDQGTVICAGSVPTFRASLNITDQQAQLQWKRNGQVITGVNQFFFTPIDASYIQDGDQITCDYTSFITCSSIPNPILSNALRLSVETLAAPTNLEAKTGNGLKINLTWQDNSNRESRFLIERSEDDNLHFVPYTYVNANEKSYIDQYPNVNALKTYFYRVRAVVDNYTNCYSEYSNESGAATGISDIITHLDDLNGRTLTVFPNPSQNGMFYLKYQGTQLSNMDIEVRNLFGQSLLKQNMPFKTNENTVLDLSKYASGMYWLFVQKGDKQMVIKILRE